MAHVHFMLSTEGYLLLEYVILIAFLTATVVAWMCLIVTLYVHCLSCFLFSISVTSVWMYAAWRENIRGWCLAFPFLEVSRIICQILILSIPTSFNLLLSLSVSFMLCENYLLRKIFKWKWNWKFRLYCSASIVHQSSCMCWRSLECRAEYLSSRWQVNCTYCCGSGKG